MKVVVLHKLEQIIISVSILQKMPSTEEVVKLIITTSSADIHLLSNTWFDNWAPKLQQLTQKIIHRHYGWKKFESTPFQRPTAGELPKYRKEGYRTFQLVVLEFSGPIPYNYKIKEKKLSKAWLFCDSLSGTLYLDILKYRTLTEFFKSLKRFVARRWRPENICRQRFNVCGSCKMVSKGT